MTACILWTKGLSHNGYPLTSVNNKTYRAHRLAYCEANGLDYTDIKGLVVMHTCDVPKCVNPEHLVLGTHGENMLDMVKKGRAAKGSDNSQTKLTPAQVQFIRDNYKYRDKVYNTVTLARMFGVNNTTIGKVVNNIYHI